MWLCRLPLLCSLTLLALPWMRAQASAQQSISCSTAQAGKKSHQTSNQLRTEVALNRDSTGDELLVSVSVNSSADVDFVLDTGAGVTILAPSLIQALGAVPAGEFTGFRLSGERIDSKLYIVPVIRLGTFARHCLIVAAWDGLDKMHLSGILSLSFFGDAPFTIDFVHQKLILESSNSLLSRVKTSVSVPLQFDDQRGISRDVFAPFAVGSQPLSCEVDTGSQGYILASRYMATLGLAPGAPGVIEHDHQSILGATEKRYVAEIPALRLGTSELRVPSPKAMFEDIIYDCNVGLEFWRGRVLSFDLANQRLLISKTRSDQK